MLTNILYSIVFIALVLLIVVSSAPNLRGSSIKSKSNSFVNNVVFGDRKLLDINPYSDALFEDEIFELPYPVDPFILQDSAGDLLSLPDPFDTQLLSNTIPFNQWGNPYANTADSLLFENEIDISTVDTTLLPESFPYGTNPFPKRRTIAEIVHANAFGTTTGISLIPNSLCGLVYLPNGVLCDNSGRFFRIDPLGILERIDQNIIISEIEAANGVVVDSISEIVVQTTC